MASSKEFLSLIMERLSELPEVAFRPMMGEYVLYYRDKVIGGVYDDRFWNITGRCCHDVTGTGAPVRPNNP